MFLLSFHKTVNSVMIWIESPPVSFHNEHTTMLERKQRKTVRLSEKLWHGVPENERLLREYLTCTYPPYFGLQLYEEKPHEDVRYFPT
jgi:hypothetical protein